MTIDGEAAPSRISIDVHDHGTICDKKKSKIRCSYCGKVVSGFYRLKCHLGGIRGDVIPCERVPESVKEAFKNEILERKKGQTVKNVVESSQSGCPRKRNFSRNLNYVRERRSRRAHTPSVGYNMKCLSDDDFEDGDNYSDVNGYVMFPPRATGSQSCTEEKDTLSRETQKLIGRFLFESGNDLSFVNYPSFQMMINGISSYNHLKFDMPSCEDLKGWILRDELQKMQEHVNRIKHSWEATACSILLDGWIDGNGRHLFSFLVDCPQGPVYLQSYDVSDFIDDVEQLVSLLNKIIEEVGSNNVIQVIASSTEGWMGAVGEQFNSKHPTAFWTVSASYCVGLILEKIGMMDCTRKILELTESVIGFICEHEMFLSLLNHSLCKDLNKTFKTKLAIPYIRLNNLVAERSHLVEMFCSSEWKSSTWASRLEGKKLFDLVMDTSFWTDVEKIQKVSAPLVRVLQSIDEAYNQQMGYIYETMDRLKEEIRNELNNISHDYIPYWNIIDEVWNNDLHSPLHAAGYYLNPSLRYSSNFHSDEEVYIGLLHSIVRTVQDKHSQELITQQLKKYSDATGFYRKGSARNTLTCMPPVTWWSQFGQECPELQRFAMRILSQTCDGVSRYALKRSMAEKLLTKRRSCIEQKYLTDLTFVHYNLQLAHYQQGFNNANT